MAKEVGAGIGLLGARKRRATPPTESHPHTTLEGGVGSASALTFFSLAGLASGCLSRGFLNHGQLSVACLPSHLSHLSALPPALPLGAASGADDDDAPPGSAAPLSPTLLLLLLLGPGGETPGVALRPSRFGGVSVLRPPLEPEAALLLLKAPRLPLLDVPLYPVGRAPMRSMVEKPRMVAVESRAPPRRKVRSGGVGRRMSVDDDDPLVPLADVVVRSPPLLKLLPEGGAACFPRLRQLSAGSIVPESCPGAISPDSRVSRCAARPAPPSAERWMEDKD